MKIIKSGIPYSKPTKTTIEKYWWEDREFRCKNCECIFKLERADFPHFIQMYETYIRLTCPDCELRLNITKPTRKNKLLDVELNNPALFEEIFGKGGVFSKIFGGSHI